ncbi:hypothetical protein VINI7043_06745 [Vibrio nigripulchritudo ATCC 27043]|nr:hypothetical protein VINI7043_06745 [Vibrio nigripulchritudo ATCC 27043]
MRSQSNARAFKAAFQSIYIAKKFRFIQPKIRRYRRAEPSTYIFFILTSIFETQVIFVVWKKVI